MDAINHWDDGDLKSHADLDRIVEVASVPLSNPRFADRTRVHDWRNYVPEWAERGWKSLTHRERAIIAVMAEEKAASEHWE